MRLAKPPQREGMLFKANVGDFDGVRDSLAVSGFKTLSVEELLGEVNAALLRERLRLAATMDPEFASLGIDFGLYFYIVDGPDEADPLDIPDIKNKLSGWWVLKPPILPPAEVVVESGAVDDRFKDHLSSKPLGMSLRSAWAYEGGRGTLSTTLIDVEFAWNVSVASLSHASIEPFPRGNPSRYDPESKHIAHGTKTLSLLCNRNRTPKEVEGIVPGIAFKHASILTGNVGDNMKLHRALLLAALWLTPGDIVLFEIESDNERPIETETRLTREAIRLLSALGVVTVEPAGNAGVDLGENLPLSPNDTGEPFHSGALLVSAINERAGGISRLTRSNYGGRVDNCAYSFLKALNDKGEEENFNDTSCASAVLAGLIAQIQSILVEAWGRKLTVREVRALLRQEAVAVDGTFSDTTRQKVGVLPRMEHILRELLGPP